VLKTVFFFRIKKEGYVHEKSWPHHTYREWFTHLLQQSPASVVNIKVINSKLFRELWVTGRILLFDSKHKDQHAVGLLCIARL